MRHYVYCVTAVAAKMVRSILTKFCTQILRGKIPVEFVNGHNRYNRLKMARLNSARFHKQSILCTSTCVCPDVDPAGNSLVLQALIRALITRTRTAWRSISVHLNYPTRRLCVKPSFYIQREFRNAPAILQDHDSAQQNEKTSSKGHDCVRNNALFPPPPKLTIATILFFIH